MRGHVSDGVQFKCWTCEPCTISNSASTGNERWRQGTAPFLHECPFPPLRVDQNSILTLVNQWPVSACHST